MRIGLAIAGLVLTNAAMQPLAHSAGHIVGAGTQSCSVWNKARDAHPPTTSDTIIYASMTNWMLGYVTLLSAATDADPPSREVMESYVDDYCSKRPLAFFYEGVQQLTIEWKNQAKSELSKPQ